MATRFLVATLFFILPLTALAVSSAPPRVRSSGSPPLHDMTGQPVVTTLPAKRAVIFPRILRNYLAIDQGPDHILAATPSYVREIQRTLLGKAYPNLSRIGSAVTLGDSVIPAGPEQLLLLKPDAVFTWSWFADGLAAAGLPVIELNVDFRDAEASDLAAWRLMAAVTEQNPRAVALLARARQAEESLHPDLPPATAAKRPTVLYAFANGRDGLHALVGDHNLPSAIEHAGGTDAAASLLRGQLDLEQLLQMNPDVIFLDWSSGSHRTPSELYAEPALSSLSAVQHRRIYILPQGGAGMDNVNERPLLERWMAELFYPKDMSRKFRQDFKDTYRDVYHYAVSDDALDAAIHLKENLTSAGFDRFLRPATKP